MSFNTIHTKNNLKISTVSNESELKLRLIEGGISAGFPSPNNNFWDDSIDLNKFLIKNPSTSFIAFTDGFSMIDLGISNKDLLIVDRSLKPKNGNIAVCIIDGEFVLKRIKVDDQDDVWLMPANDKYKPLKITDFHDFEIWGIVTYSIQKQ
jgi:DNA polymerase V